MAINLTVTLTDTEQARIVEVAAAIVPDMTGPELKAWAEAFMKAALRDKVRERALELSREAANAARRADLEALDTDWPPSE